MSRAYTLIEVVVVLAVLAITAAVVGPAVGRAADDVKARAQVAAVTAFLRSAREQAVTRQQPYQVVLEPEARVLLLRRAGRQADGSVQASRYLGARVRMEAPAASARQVTFLPQGMSSGARFRIETSGSRVYLVTVDVLTGRVSTERGAS